jgi:hypothetical protein
MRSQHGVQDAAGRVAARHVQEVVLECPLSDARAAVDVRAGGRRGSGGV